jgi:hypothetical protein
MSDVAAPTPPRPGYKTSEFYLSLAAILLSHLLAADVIPVGGTAERIVTIAGTILGALGYAVTRAVVKRAA